jgi:lipoprotein-releasing system permease protein
MRASEYEMTFGNLRLNLSNGSGLAQAAYFGSFDPLNTSLKSVIVPISKADLFEGLHNMGKGRIQPSLWLQIKDLPGGEVSYTLPRDPIAGEGVLLPKAFRDAGVRLGDSGSILYYAPTASSVQEQRLPIYVAGFYDPGIMPIGGKFVLVNPSVTNLIRSTHNQEDTTFSNGINLRFDDLDRADEYKGKLKKAFEEAGIGRYWSVQTYRDFDFTRDLMQQMRSDKHLFLLIATIIIIVACSNIISMLIILVNDKKREIGILRSMGASSYSVAAIFGLCGMLMGIVGSILGSAAAYFTLKNIGALTSFISSLQGYDAFNPLYYGDVLPNQISAEALLFVSLTTGLISLLAGIIPAVKASMLRPSAILRSE